MDLQRCKTPIKKGDTVEILHSVYCGVRVGTKHKVVTNKVKNGFGVSITGIFEWMEGSCWKSGKKTRIYWFLESELKCLRAKKKRKKKKD